MKFCQTGRCNKAEIFEKRRVLMYEGAKYDLLTSVFKAIKNKSRFVNVLLFDVYKFPYFQIDYMGQYPIIINATHQNSVYIMKFLLGKSNILPREIIYDPGLEERNPNFIFFHLRRQLAKGFISPEQIYKGFYGKRYSYIDGVRYYGKYPMGTLDYGIFPHSKEEMEEILCQYYPTWKSAVFFDNQIKLEIP